MHTAFATPHCVGSEREPASVLSLDAAPSNVRQKGWVCTKRDPLDHLPINAEFEGHPGLAAVEPCCSGTGTNDDGDRCLGRTVEELRHLLPSLDVHRRSQRNGGGICIDSHGWSKNGEQCCEMATPCCCQERIHHHRISLESPVIHARVDLDDLATRPRRQFASGLRGASQNVSDRDEIEAEAVVQHERDPLSGCQPVQQHLEGNSHRFRQHCLLERVRRTINVIDVAGNSGQRDAEPKPVQAQPGGHRRQPGREIADVVPAALHPDPRILDDILRLVRITQHSCGDPQQLRPLLLEGSGEVHVSHLPSIRARRRADFP